MIYLLANQGIKQNAINYILTLPDDGKFEVVIKEYKKKRSLAQNRLYWLWLPYLAKHFGYTDDEMHDELKYAFIGEESYTNRKGVVRFRPISTTTLKVKEFAEFLTKIEVLANNNDVILPMPHDFQFAMMRE